MDHPHYVLNNVHGPQSGHHPTHLFPIPRLGVELPTSLQIHPRDTIVFFSKIMDHNGDVVFFWKIMDHNADVEMVSFFVQKPNRDPPILFNTDTYTIK